MDKVIRDGNVAVLYSPGFGGGWSTWADVAISDHLLFDPDVVAWVEGGKTGPFPDLKAKYGDDHFYPDDIETLEIKWLPVGTRFIVQEYDGSEYIALESRFN